VTYDHKQDDMCLETKCNFYFKYYIQVTPFYDDDSLWHIIFLEFLPQIFKTDL
jgi:hypothetical protein